ncbi:hypothetical protein [Mycobacterium sp. ST-F2]|uniref:hypothetical protein n=1 Tax=Mycobacterium sp. ST-F2 TaxID=1490484 RepID=UPI000B1BF8CC|nr:hypothetical protein [Mycobacterium sp. ST-F2]
MDFVTAKASQRITVVRSIAEMYAEDYTRGPDFYRDVREALREGIIRGDDVRRLNEAAASHAGDNRRDSYRAVAAGWEQWRQRKALSVFATTEKWREQQLQVNVSPAFIWRQRGGSRLVVPYYKGEELSTDAAQAATRIVELTFGAEHGRAAVLDVRRARLHQARQRRSRDYDAWLSGEVSAFLRMLRSIGRPAA